MIGEAGAETAPRSVHGFVAVQPDGQLHSGQHPHTVLFSEHRGFLERVLPPGVAQLVPATLVLHPDHATDLG